MLLDFQTQFGKWIKMPDKTGKEALRNSSFAVRNAINSSEKIRACFTLFQDCCQYHIATSSDIYPDSFNESIFRAEAEE